MSAQQYSDAAAAAGAVCVLHKRHNPPNLTVEEHHVVPRAWQAIWAPGGTPLPNGGLWHPETRPLCPTGHRNVHALLVEAMHDAAATWDPATAPDANVAAVRAAVLAKHPRWVASTLDISLVAMYTWVDSGGALATLWNAGEWGEA